MVKNEDKALKKLVDIAYGSYRIGYKGYPKVMNKRETRKRLEHKLKKFRKTSIDNILIVLYESYMQGWKDRRDRKLREAGEIKAEIKEELLKEM